MLHDEPCRLSRIAAYLALAGPAERVENRFEPGSVRIVNGAHPGVISIEQRSILRELRPYP
jgi:hypothetical protein